MFRKGRGKNVNSLDWNLRLQEVLERTAEYDMSLMDDEQNRAYAERLLLNRKALEIKKAARSA
jgi:hypothetical protein